MKTPLLSPDEALRRVLDLVTPMAIESVPLHQASGRVLAAPVIASRNQPPFAASAMDGYAIRAEDAAIGAVLEVVGEAAAGGRYEAEVKPGESVRIFTGAPLPEGADTVVIQEDVDREGDQITFREVPAKGAHIRPAGIDFQVGSRIAAPRRLIPNEIALSASMNAPFLEVYRKPLVAIIATGDELVPPGGNPGPNQIISSNNYGLAAMLEACGAEARIDPIAGDTKEALVAALDRAADADLIVTLGGASVGDHDLVRQVFGDEGMDLSFYRVAMRPGKPLMAGRVRGKPMVGLPGNPVSSMVLAHLLLRPMMDAFQGLEAGPAPRVRARLGSALKANGPREHYIRARLEENLEGNIAFPYPNQDSSLLSILASANALIVMPANAEAREAGDEVEVIRL